MEEEEEQQQRQLLQSYDSIPGGMHSTVSEPFTFSQSPSSSSFSSSSDGSPAGSSKTSCNGESMIEGKKRSGKKGGGGSFAYRIRDHVRMGPKFSETVKGKLRLGARIIKEGGRGNIFRRIFGDIEGEELLKASNCYLSTSDGPIAGLLFISTQRVAFCSERPIAFRSPDGESLMAPYKVVIPVEKIKRANQSENVDKPEQKYIEIVTQDNFEFWFMGFLRYEKACKNLEKAIFMANSAQA